MTKKELKIEKKILKFQKQPHAQAFHSGKFLKPTPQEIRELRKFFKLTQVDMAIIVGAAWDAKRGSATVGSWEAKVGTAEHRSIPYSAWRLLLIHVGVVNFEEGLEFP